MEKNASTTSLTAYSSRSEIRRSNYLRLLEEIDQLSVLSTRDISEIETILKNVAESIDWISDQKNFRRGPMLLITILNALIRISVIEGSSFILSQQSFQLTFKKLSDFIGEILRDANRRSMCASDISDSMLRNLVNDNFIEICFKRFLSNEKLPKPGNILSCCHY